MILTVAFVFFKQKTAYEMRISDWSSDVCSSDLKLLRCAATRGPARCARHAVRTECDWWLDQCDHRRSNDNLPGLCAACGGQIRPFRLRSRRRWTADPGFRQGSFPYSREGR